MKTRKATNALIELAEEGAIDWKELATSALVYMSEYDVLEMADSEGFSELFMEDIQDEY